MAFFFDPEILIGDLADENELELDFSISIRDCDPEVPTCTEDGIPIRKIYIGNLPQNVTRTELFEFFTQYGQIKNCWVKTSSDASIKPYAFITFVDPQDAHRALKAPQYKNFMCGKKLRVQPADSWHQPISGPDGNIIWDSQKPNIIEDSQDGILQNEETSSSSHQEFQPKDEVEFTILDKLNPDCLAQILSYVSVRDLVRSELVCKRWQAMVHDYYLSFRTFRTSSWDGYALTTAMLRNLLQRMGPSLTSLHIDSHEYKLNDRTPQVIGKFCPNLETLAIHAMATVNWNPALHYCKNLHTIRFIACHQISDNNLSSLFRLESEIHTLSLQAMQNIEGKFLKNMKPKIHTLEISRCSSINGEVLACALPEMSELKSLTLDTVRGFNAIRSLVHLTKLEELRLCNLTYEASTDWPKVKEQLAEGISKMTDLRTLSLIRHPWCTQDLMNTISDTCAKLRKLDLIGAGKESEQQKEATLPPRGLAAIASKCSDLEQVNVSSNSCLGACVAALAGATQLRSLTARGSELLTDQDVIKCVQSCHQLESIDVFGCTRITGGLVSAVISELEQRPRHMKLYLGETEAQEVEVLPEHPLLTIDFSDKFGNARFYYSDDDDDDDDDEEDFDPCDADDFYDFYDSDDDYYSGVHHGYDVETGEYVGDEYLEDLDIF